MISLILWDNYTSFWNILIITQLENLISLGNILFLSLKMANVDFGPKIMGLILMCQSVVANLSLAGLPLTNIGGENMYACL